MEGRAEDKASCGLWSCQPQWVSLSAHMFLPTHRPLTGRSQPASAAQPHVQHLDTREDSTMVTSTTSPLRVGVASLETAIGSG